MDFERLKKRMIKRVVKRETIERKKKTQGVGRGNERGRCRWTQSIRCIFGSVRFSLGARQYLPLE